MRHEQRGVLGQLAGVAAMCAARRRVDGRAINGGGRISEGKKNTKNPVHSIIL